MFLLYATLVSTKANIEKDSVLLLNTQANDVQININKCRVLITDISYANKTITVNDGVLDYFYIKKTEGNIINNIDVYNSEVNVKIIDILNCSGKNEYEFSLEDENHSDEFLYPICGTDHKQDFLQSIEQIERYDQNSHERAEN